MSETGKHLFAPDGEAAQAIRDWWASLHGDHGERGELAELRRAQTAQEVVLCRAFQRLRVALLAAGVKGDEQCAAVARVLAQVKKALPAGSFAARMGHGENDQPAVNEARFKRLLREKDRNALAGGLVRVLPLLDHGADPLSLAADIWLWGEGVQRRWANDYYQAIFTKKENAK